MGDAGALPLGFFLATLYLGGYSESTDPGRARTHRSVRDPIVRVDVDRTRTDPSGVCHHFGGSPDHFALRLHEQAGWSKKRVLATSATLGGFFGVWCFVPSRPPPRACRGRPGGGSGPGGNSHLRLLLAPGSAPTGWSAVMEIHSNIRNHSTSARSRSTIHASGSVARRHRWRGTCGSSDRCPSNASRVAASTGRSKPRSHAGSRPQG